MAKARVKGTYSKKQLASSKELGAKWPIVLAVLEDDKLYTKEEAIKLVQDFEKKEVDR